MNEQRFKTLENAASVLLAERNRRQAFNAIFNPAIYSAAEGSSPKYCASVPAQSPLHPVSPAAARQKRNGQGGAR